MYQKLFPLFFTICLLVNYLPAQEVPYDSLRQVLETMYDRDQGMRKILEDSIGYDSPEAPAYMGKIYQQDQKHQAELKLILEKYNWLGISKIGKKANAAIFYIIQHSTPEMMEKYFPTLKDLAQEGEAPKRMMALMEDRILTYRGKKQKYGTQTTRLNADENIFYVWPIEDPENVNARRKAVGIESTVEEIAEAYGFIYQPDLKLSEIEMPKN